MTDIINAMTKQEISRKIIAYMMASGCWHCEVLCDEFEDVAQGKRLCSFEKNGRLSSCVNAVINTMQNNPKKLKRILKVINDAEERLRR